MLGRRERRTHTSQRKVKKLFVNKQKINKLAPKKSINCNRKIKEKIKKKMKLRELLL